LVFDEECKNVNNMFLLQDLKMIFSKMAVGTHLIHLNPHPASAHKNIIGHTENKIISKQLSLFIELFQFCSFCEVVDFTGQKANAK